MNEKRNVLICLAILLCALSAPSSHSQSFGDVLYLPYAFTNFVGSPGNAGILDGLGNSARFLHPASVVVDGVGVLYVADRNPTNLSANVRKVMPDGLVTTIATGFSGFGGPFGGDYGAGPGLALDLAGTIYVADSGHHCIRRIASSGEVQTIAGRFGESGSNDGPATEARFFGPSGIAIAPDGTIYVSDSWNFTVRGISPDGTVTTLAGTAGESGFTDGNGSEARFGWIRDGALGAQGPRGLVTDVSGSLYVVDSVNVILRQISRAGTVTTYAGSARLPYSGWDGNGGAARFGWGISAEGMFDLFGPIGLAIDSRDNLYVTDPFNQAVRRVAPGAVVRTLAGYRGSGTADGVGREAKFASPEGVAVDRAGNLYVADTRNNRLTKGVQAFLELTGLSVDQGTRISCQVTGPFSAPVVIEASEDLERWSAIQTNLPPQRTLTIGLASDQTVQFLRAHSESAN